MKTKLMPRGGETTRYELRQAIFNHLSVIMSDKFDDEDVDIMTVACSDVVEDAINYLPRKHVPGPRHRKQLAQKRARRGGMPPTDAQAHFAIDGLIQLFESFAERLVDDPQYASVVNDFMRLANLAKAWLDRHPVQAEQEGGNDGEASSGL